MFHLLHALLYASVSVIQFSFHLLRLLRFNTQRIEVRIFLHIFSNIDKNTVCGRLNITRSATTVTFVMRNVKMGNCYFDTLACINHI